MITVIIIVAVFIVLIISLNQPKRIIDTNSKTDSLKDSFEKIIPDVTTTPLNNNLDDSVIDITGNSYQIQQSELKPPLQKHSVPYWRHRYIYSCNEIDDATNEQVEFYKFFKKSFLNGQFIDIEGNTNYAFILLFDLLRNDYEKHKDLKLLEKQLDDLGYYYAKTKSYAISFLIEKMNSLGDRDGVLRIKASQYNNHYQNSSSEYSFEGNYWGLGAKYKSTLNLSDDEAKILNALNISSNNFSTIEYCRLEIIKLFLLTIKAFNKKLENEETSLENHLLKLTHSILTKHLNYKQNYSNYKYSIEPTVNELYTTIYRYCENAIRENYGHKRKISTESYYSNNELITELERDFYSILPGLIEKSLVYTNPPDEKTDIILYTLNTNRWKNKLEFISNAFGENPTKFLEEVLSLGNLNKNNPSVENIFFEASKSMAKKDKTTSLSLYVYYLYYDLKSATFDNKQLTKTIQKSLFSNNDQLHEFEIILGDLVKTKNLQTALERTTNFYKVKRKRIVLNSESIKEAKEQHSDTVEILNDYLKDEYEDSENRIKSIEINNSEVQITISSKNDNLSRSGSIYSIPFTQIHTETLEFFSKSSLSVPQADLEVFAKLKGAFKNQLIESINDICFETLDDVLIEEEDDFYIINPNYYQRLLLK